MEDDAKVVDHGERIGSVLGGEVPRSPVADKCARHLVVDEERCAKPRSFRIPASDQILDALGVLLAQNERNQETGVEGRSAPLAGAPFQLVTTLANERGRIHGHGLPSAQRGRPPQRVGAATKHIGA
jgi:hypothetical protein